MAEGNDKLVGMKAIREHMNSVSEATIIHWKNLGMPIKKVKGIWIGHRKKLDDWFEDFTAAA